MNHHIIQRLSGIQSMLLGAYQANKSLSANTKGVERQTFIDSFLSQVLPNHFRFGTGDATDRYGAKSGQLDVVVEYPFVPSLPIVGSEKTRLYLAEGISAVIEVKSDVAGQWGEVQNTAKHLSVLKRQYGSGVSFGPQATSHIPFFVVGYTGWKNIETLKSKLQPGFVDGILVIDNLQFASTERFMGITADGTPAALWGLICAIHLASSMGGSLAADVPIQYVL
jgi:hypothetical protein